MKALITRSLLSFSLICLTVTVLAQGVDPKLLSALKWRNIGPFRGGRTQAVAGIPDQPNVFYIGVCNGGVWKTTDYGRVWKPIFDNQSTGSIGAITVAPSKPDVIYVGSGEGLERPDLSVGDGIYKSEDAGVTWKHLGLRDAQQIASIIVDPGDPDRIFIAALGHPYGPNKERGVFRSVDGGKTFEKVLYKDENTGAAALSFDPGNSDVVYASLWSARQAPWEIGNSVNGPGSGLFKSVDGGSTWKPLTGGLPTFKDGLGRIGFSVARGATNILYAMVDADAKHGGVYKSDDSGETWTKTNGEVRIWGRGGDFAEVKVDPQNAGTIYIANTSTYKSTDGGKTFAAIRGAPGGDDYHTVWINPNNTQIICLASDQGAVISVNGGKTWSSWFNQPTAQFYHVATDNRFPYWVYGGQQESGSAGVASRGNDGQITVREWHPVGVEEYGYVAPDPLHPNFIYGGKATRFDWATGDVQDVTPEALRTGKYRFLRTAPIQFSPADPHVLYLASQVLFKTNNGGMSWTEISPDLSRKSYAASESFGIFNKLDPDAAKHKGVIYSLGLSNLDVNLIWAGTDDGLIHLTRDGGKSWLDVTPKVLSPWSKVSIVEASHTDPNEAYAAINRFRLSDIRPHIYRTRNGGKDWTEIIKGLPENEVINSVKEDPIRKGILYCGSERSVYVSFDDGDNWQALRLNLPGTSVRDLVIHQDDLVIGTHGRGFWILDNMSPLRQMKPEIMNREIALYKPQTAMRVRWNRNTDTPMPPDEPTSLNPPDGAIFDYFLKGDQTKPITLEVFDSKNRLVRSFSSDDKADTVDPELNVPTWWIRPFQPLESKAGAHRFVWDIHYTKAIGSGHDYPISATYMNTDAEPHGPWALTGRYRVKLKAAGTSVSQYFNVKMDPRIKTSPEMLKLQFDLSYAILQAINKANTALAEIKKAKANPKVIADKKLIGELGDLEGSAPAGRRQRRASATQTLGSLSGELNGLMDALQSTDSAPLPGTVATAISKLEAMEAKLKTWDRLEKELKEKN